MNSKNYELEAKRKENENYLKLFENQMKKEGLAPRIIKKHLSNVEFYINDYLLFSSIINIEDGMSEMRDFFYYWFFAKALQSKCESVSAHIDSVTLFYKLMVDQGLANREDYEKMLCNINEYKAEWIKKFSRHNNSEGDL